jgi:Tfp pilus assembly protein PilN
MSSLPAEKPAAPRTLPSAAPRRAGSLNLASRPFVNTRPVSRVSILLWVLGLLLLLGNVSLFWSYLSGSDEKRAELERLEQEIQRQEQTVTQLEQRLASLDLEQQNRQVRYLNRKIAERTFSWSLLFDRLAEVLPNDVRLTRLAPKPLGRQDDKQPEQEPEPDQPTDDRVLLVINGRSKSDEALLDFVDRLFAHSSFEEPDLPREAREEGDDQVEFDVRVTYIPGGRPGEVAVVEEAAPPEVLEVAPPAGAPAAPGPGGDE